jgi:hypothetical protein
MKSRLKPKKKVDISLKYFLNQTHARLDRKNLTQGLKSRKQRSNAVLS